MAAHPNAGWMADTKMIKTIGEHWVCATLARHKWAPALTRDGLERTDILAVGTHLDHRPTVEIQVKTASQSSGITRWVLGLKAQELARSVHEWFVLVIVPSYPSPLRGFVVPRDHVAAATWMVHQEWRTDPTVPAGKRNAGLDAARIGQTSGNAMRSAGTSSTCRQTTFRFCYRQTLDSSPKWSG